MPAIVRCVVNLPMTSGIPEDSVVNVWHFSVDSIVTDPPLIDTALTAFYTSIDGGLSSQLATTGNTLTFYNLADVEPRAPIYEGTMGTLTLGSTALPAELAVCLSFQGSRISGQPQARRRGRLYIGPYHTAANDVGRVRSTEQTALRDAADVLLAAGVSSGTWAWGVYSRTDNQLVEVNDGWVDNAWDVQRRRGLEASTRSTFS